MAEPSQRPMPRGSLAALSAVHAALFGWAAVELPWRRWSALGVLLAALALAHASTALLAALRHAKLALVWRAQSALALAVCGYLGWGLLSSGWYVASLYGGIGEGVGAALAAGFGLVVLVTVPLAAWGLSASGGVKLGRTGALLVVAALALAIGRLAMLSRSADAEALIDEAAREALPAELSRRLRTPEGVPARPPSLMTAEPARCPEALSRERAALVLTFAGEAGVETHCVQAGGAELAERAAAVLEERGAEPPIKIDLIAARAPVPEGAPIASLTVRPGLDGVCLTGPAVRCLMPWQLVALDVLTSHQLLESVPDARLGASLPILRRMLGGDSQEPLVRIRTDSWLLAAGGELTPMDRTIREPIEPSAETLARASRLAEGYILWAQRGNGRFRYLVHPFTGEVRDEPFSIARQAGTTLALCELGTSGRAQQRAVRRSLDLLARLEQPIEQRGGALGMLRYPPETTAANERLGPVALSLAALMRCRARTGDRYDDMIGRLARTVLAQQRADGGFHHRFDARTGAPEPGKGTLYVDGQAVLALALVEAEAEPAPSWPDKAALHAAVERAMDYFGGPYWDGFVRPLFFIEENWHCIAAAAAREQHPHEPYQQLCLDYVTFKSRLVHDEDSGVHADFVGGYGVGNVVPPHNTATAGFGEALAAAIAIKRARGLDTSAEQATMRRAMRFLLNNQWTHERCYACSHQVRAVGGFSEHMASPLIRIDYVQHAWAALGHGARALGLEVPES